MAFPKSKFVRVLLILFVVIGLLVAFGPWLAISLFGKSIAEKNLREQLACPVELSGLSGGWSGAHLDFIKLGQPPGFESVSEPLAEVRGVDVKLSVLGAIFGNINADITIDSLNATVARGASGVTNLQKIMRPKIQEEKKRSSDPAETPKNGKIPEFAFSLKSGTIVAKDLEAGAEAVMDQLSIQASRRGTAAPATFQLNCNVKGAGAQGSLGASGKYDFATGDGDAELKPEHIDLAAFSPFIAATRFATKTSGTLDGGIKVNISKNGAVAGNGKLVVANLRMEGGRLEAPLVEPNITITPNFAWTPEGNILTAEGFAILASSLQLEGSGTLDPAKPSQVKLKIASDLAAAQKALAPFFPANAKIDGRIDGEILITANPGGASNFNVKIGARAVRATGSGEAAAVPTDGILTLTGSASADFHEFNIDKGSLDLGAIARGEFKGKWKKADAPRNAPQAPPGPGQVEADIQMTASLAQAAERFRALMPAGLGVDGTISSNCKITTDETQEMKFDIQADAKELRVRGTAGPDAPGWLAAIATNPIIESQIHFEFKGSSDPRFDRFDIKNVSVDTSSGAIRFQAKATGGMWNLASSLKAKIHAESALEKLAPYLAAWLPARLQIAGNIITDVDFGADSGYVKGPMTLAANRVVVSARPRGAAPATPLDESLDRIVNSPVRLDELKISGDAAMNRAENEIRIPNFRLTTNPDVIQCSGIVTSAVDANAAGGSSSFDGEIRAELEPLLKLVGAFVPAGTRAAGSFAMKGNIARSPKDIGWNLNGKIINFSAQAAGMPALAPERELAMEFIGKFTPSPGGFDCLLDRTRAVASSGAFNLDISGKVTKTKDIISGSGRGMCGANLAWVASLMPGAMPAGSALEGMLKSDFNLNTNGDVLAFTSNASVEMFKFTSPGNAPVADPNLGLTIAVNYDNAKDELSVGKLDVATSSRWMESKINNLQISGMRSGRGIRMEGAGELKADLATLLNFTPAALPAGMSAAGKLVNTFNISNAGALTRFQLQSSILQFKVANAGAQGAPPSEFTDPKVNLDLAGSLDSARGELVLERGNFGTEGGAIAATVKNFAIRAMTTDRRIEGDFIANAQGAALSRLAAPWLPQGCTFEDKANLSAKLSGNLGKDPLANLRAAGDFALPTIVYRDALIRNARGKYTIADGIFTSEDVEGDVVKGTGDNVKNGRMAASVRAQINNNRYPFGVSFKTVALPANQAVAAPLSHMFPLFAGNYQFASFDGSLDSEGSLQGDGVDWKQTLEGNIILNMKQVKLVESQEFGQVLSLLKLNALNSTHESIKETLRIANGKITIQSIEVDGDASKLPLVGSISFEGALAVGVDLSRARLGRDLEAYRPLVSLFQPQFQGTVNSPSFGIATPSPDKLLQAAGKMAAGSLLGNGPKLDLSKLSRVNSLGDLASFASESQAGGGPGGPDNNKPPMPQLPVPGPQNPQKPNPQNPPKPGPQPPVVDAPAAPGGMPVNLNRTFRALAKGRTKFDYSALNQNTQIADQLREWLTAPPPPQHVAKPDARLADLLNRFEVALALAVAAEIKDPLFSLTHGKKGVHDISNFFERSLNVSGATTDFAAMKEEIRKLGGDAAVFSIPGAAVDLPWIDRTGVDANDVKKSIAERASQYLARVQLTPKGLIAVPQYLYRNFNSDEAKIRAILKKYLAPNHPALAKVDDAKLVKLPESLELDQP